MKLWTGPRPHSQRLLLLWLGILTASTWGKSCQDVTNTLAVLHMVVTHSAMFTLLSCMNIRPSPPFWQIGSHLRSASAYLGQNSNKKDQWGGPFNSGTTNLIWPYFSTTEWYVFQDNNIDTYTDVVRLHQQMHRWRCTEDYCTDIPNSEALG